MITQINKNWLIRSTNGGKEYISDLPATVANVLYTSSDMPDPYFGENEWDCFERLRQDYIFTNTFDLTQQQLEGDRLVMVFDGIDTVADIFLNNQKLDSVNNMHRTYELDVTGIACVGKNELKLNFTSGIDYALALHEKDPYYITSDTVNGFSMVRKSHCSYGWDWGPQLPDIGIWRGVRLVSYTIAILDDLYIRQHHHNGAVTITAELKTKRLSGNDPLVATMCVTSPQGDAVKKTVVLESADASISLVIQDPQLWWCNGFGGQPLYAVQLALTCNDILLDVRNADVGLRTLTVRQEKDEWGESFEFCINGTSIFAMGANYIPEDSIYPRCSRERTEKLIKQCVAANYNCIRVWGGGYFCDNWFYELCDRYGLIVWQDLLFACGVYRLKDGFVDNVVAETRDNVRRLRHHACIGLWCGNNELEWGWSGWDMGFGNDPCDRADYIKLFEWILPETVKSVDPDRFYWLASPSSGGSFDDPNDQNRGDVHYWEVWHRLKHFTEYRKYHFRFCSEFGFQSFPSEKTIDSFALPEDKNIFSPVMENHQKNGSANGRILFYLSANFRYPTSFEALLYASQILQAEAIKYGVEHWRSNRGRCMGSLYWQLNDCWPVASWASIDYFNRWKPLHYYAKRFYAPVLLAALEEDGRIRFVISNETMRQVVCRVVWRLRRNTGEIIEERHITSKVPSLVASQVAEADYSSYGKARDCYLEYTLYSDDSEVSSSSLLFVRPKHFEFIKPQISVSVKECKEGFVLSFATDSYAKYVTFDSPDFDFVADDNCFDLSPGRIKIVTVDRGEVSRPVTKNDWNKLGIQSAYDIR